MRFVLFVLLLGAADVYAQGRRILFVDEAKIRQSLELAGHSVGAIDTLLGIGSDDMSVPTSKAVVDYVADLAGLDTAYVVGDSLFLVYGEDTTSIKLVNIGNSDLTLYEDRNLNASGYRFSLSNPFFAPSSSGFSEVFDVFNIQPGRNIFYPFSSTTNWFRDINTLNDTTSSFFGLSYNIELPGGVIGWDSYNGMMVDVISMGLQEEAQVPVMGVSTYLKAGGIKTNYNDTYLTTPTGRYAWSRTSNSINHTRSQSTTTRIQLVSEEAQLTGVYDTLGLQINIDPDSLSIQMAQDGDGAGGFAYQPVFAISAEKVVRMPQYGTGSTISGPAANIAAWDADGNMVPVHPDSLGGGGGITLDTVLVQTDTLIDWNLKNFKVVQLDMTSVTSITMEFSNPTDPLFGTLQFRNVSGTDSVTFPGNVYWMDETSVGTLNITQNTKFTIIYDGSDYFIE